MNTIPISASLANLKSKLSALDDIEEDAKKETIQALRIKYHSDFAASVGVILNHDTK